MASRLRLIFPVVWALACSKLAGFDDLTGAETEGGRSGSSGRSSSSGRSGSSGSGGAMTGGGGVPSDGGVPSEPGAGTTAVAANGGSAPAAGTGGASPPGGAAGADAGGGGSQNTAGAMPGGSGGRGGTGSGGGGRTGCNVNLLGNADFEAGPVGWREDSSWPGIVDVTDIIVARDHSALMSAGVVPFGNYLAWLGGVPDTERSNRVNLMQDIAIPAETARIVISGQILIKTEEDPLGTFDQVVIQLEDASEGWIFRVWYDRDRTADWVPFEVNKSEALEPLLGRTLTFRVESDTDEGSKTSFWFDSLSLVAECDR